jgi:hypothetical protein
MFSVQGQHYSESVRQEEKLLETFLMPPGTTERLKPLDKEIFHQ